MTIKREFKDGDVYFWNYKNPVNPGSYGSYHCKSQIAIASNGTLYDTYWSDYSKPVSTSSDIKLIFKGNINSLDEIKKYDVDYYRSEDVVDLRHPNSSCAKIYVKTGAKRDTETMLKLVEYQIERNHSNIRSAKSSIEQLEKAIEQINAGELDPIYIPVCN